MRQARKQIGPNIAQTLHEAATGAERWSFFTGDPVRLAPAIWKDRVFAASDDGHLYCLDGRTGKLPWDKNENICGTIPSDGSNQGTKKQRRQQ